MGTTSFQLYLLSTMRAPRLVDEALRRLDAKPSDVTRAKTEMAKLGLESLGHSIGIYESLLGPPLVDQELQDDSRGSRVLVFRLPLWNELAFAVYGTEVGAINQMQFGRFPGTAPLALEHSSALVPWRVVEDDLEASTLSRTIVNEWYPMKDVRCAIPGGGEGEGILRFDLGLLQSVDVAGGRLGTPQPDPVS
jgi:hypothetical protein